jgi:hypothetical protein
MTGADGMVEMEVGLVKEENAAVKAAMRSED